ncbi:sulfurtransferase [Streptomyces sp. NPDC058657]|uniref:sulfurtransferase n=1 Tax=unclassified Streptomyces TaxID=2593676 RepID=UPI003662788E
MSARGTTDVTVPGPLVGTQWLAERLGQPGVVVLDASVGAHRGRGPWIPGARPFDIDGEMSAHGPDLPPHTMPDADQFTESVRALGVGDGDCVVVYDGAGIYSAARAWWMLRAMGCAQVAVLDGGLPGWRAAGLPVDSRAPDPASYVRGDFTARPRSGAFVGREEVRRALADEGSAVLDARSRGRFAGTEPEPRAGLRPGHMPGAVNLPFGELLDGDGRMRPVPELRRAFGELGVEGRRWVVSCGSGVTACVLALGADLAGHGDASVYDGSWSEWGLEGAGTPVVTEGASA